MREGEVIDVLAALAHETRLRIFRMLVEYRPVGLAAGRVGEILGIGPANLSFHLNHLKKAGLVTARRDGRSIIYRAEVDVLDDLTGFLRENCCTAVDGADEAAD